MADCKSVVLTDYEGSNPSPPILPRKEVEKIIDKVERLCYNIRVRKKKDLKSFYLVLTSENFSPLWKFLTIL